jgi:transketolase
MTAPRDIFIEKLFELAKKDSSIIFISVDLGAPSLDKWRAELPDQFIAAGISEQNAINVAAGLAASGKKPYVYMMASWAARCFEQIRYSCAMGGNPITILGNGVALGYAPAGPAHEPTEDLAYMRAIEGIEIHSPSSAQLTLDLAIETVKNPKLRYVRLERSVDSTLEAFTTSDSCYFKNGMHVNGFYPGNNGAKKIAIFSSGYLLHRAGKVCEMIANETKFEVTLIDFWRIKPIDLVVLEENVKNCDFLISIEEQALFGGFSGAILESLSDLKINKALIRFGLNSAFIFENGTRDQLLDSNGLKVEEIASKCINQIMNN